MPHYGAFLYGSDVYGQFSAQGNYLWSFLVKWDDEDYDTSNEGTRMVDLTITRGRDFFIKNRGTGWERFQAGTAVGIFDNDDGRYDPYNTDSPLYPNVLPGKFVKIYVKDVDGDTNYSLMWGRIADIQPMTSGGRKLSAIKVVDGLDWLAERTVKVGYSASSTTDDIISSVLTDAGFPTSEWAYTAADTGKAATYHWAWRANALEEIHDMEDFDIGAFFHSREGDVRFYPGDYAVWGAIAINEDDLLRDISIRMPWEVVRNETATTLLPILSLTGVTLYDMNVPPYPLILSGDSRTFKVPYSVVGAYNASEVCATSIASVTHTVLTWPGVAPDITASCPVTYDNTNLGTDLEITITNNSASTGSITALTVTGNCVFKSYTVDYTDSDTDSIATYGNKEFTINGKWFQTTAGAEAQMTYVLTNLADAHKFPIIQIENRPATQFAGDLYKDIVTLTAPTLGIDAQTYRIGKIEHRWLLENGQAIRTTWKLEPQLPAYSFP